MAFTYIDTPYSDRNAAPPIHDDTCDELCNHCALCGEGIYIGARCPSHMGVYPLTDRQVGDRP